jgi:hypothetical protein
MTGSQDSRPTGGRRIEADADKLGDGLGQLLLAVLELVRQLMERQALHRVDSGSLDDEQVERLGSALMALEDRFARLCDEFGCRPEDLDIRLPFDAGQLLADDRRQHTSERRFAP